MGKLFGTDGIRGIVGENLTVELAFQVGRSGCRPDGGEGEVSPPLPSARTPVSPRIAGGGADGGHLRCGR